MRATDYHFCNDLHALRCVDKIIPGHGPVGGKEMITRQIAYLQDLRSAVREAAEGDASLEEVKKKVSLPALKVLQEPGLLPQNIEAVYEEISAKDGK